MDANVKIRYLDVSEVNSMYELIFNGFKDFIVPTLSSEGKNSILEYIQIDEIKYRLEKNHFILGAIYQNEIIGLIEVRQFKHITLFFVNKYYHKKSIGKQLLTECIKICKKK